LKIETNIIASITMSPIGQAVRYWW